MRAIVSILSQARMFACFTCGRHATRDVVLHNGLTVERHFKACAEHSTNVAIFNAEMFE